MNPKSRLWYAVYTKPKWEKKVSELLSRKQITNYCPVNRVLKQWHDRKKWVDEPMFTSYVFVQVAPEEQAEVRKTSGVLNYVYWLGKPAVIREDEIQVIQEFLGAHQNVQLEKTRIRVEDRVKIVSGPLYQQEGTVVAVQNKTIKVILPTLGYAMVATIEKQNVEVLVTDQQAVQNIRA